MKGILFKPDMHKAIREGGKTVTRRLAGLKEINQEADKWTACIGVARIIPPARIGDLIFQHQDGHCELTRPRYQVGEVVYIKEAWMVDKEYDNLKPSDIPEVGRKVAIWYYRDGNHYADKVAEGAGKVRSPLFMPAWAARHFIQITDVRAERLQEITEEDAVLEGLKAKPKEIWWQGYRELDLGETGKELMHQQTIGENPPDWMIEPHKMLDRPDIDAIFSARNRFSALWDSINKEHQWASNPFVWRYEFKRVEKPMAVN